MYQFFFVIFVTAKLPKDTHLPFQRNVVKTSRRNEGDSLKHVIVLLSGTHKTEVILKILSNALRLHILERITWHTALLTKPGEMAN